MWPNSNWSEFPAGTSSCSLPVCATLLGSFLCQIKSIGEGVAPQTVCVPPCLHPVYIVYVPKIFGSVHTQSHNHKQTEEGPSECSAKVLALVTIRFNPKTSQQNTTPTTTTTTEPKGEIPNRKHEYCHSHYTRNIYTIYTS